MRYFNFHSATILVLLGLGQTIAAPTGIHVRNEDVGLIERNTLQTTAGGLHYLDTRGKFPGVKDPPRTPTPPAPITHTPGPPKNPPPVPPKPVDPFDAKHGYKEQKNPVGWKDHSKNPIVAYDRWTVKKGNDLLNDIAVSKDGQDISIFGAYNKNDKTADPNERALLRDIVKAVYIKLAGQEKPSNLKTVTIRDIEEDDTKKALQEIHFATTKKEDRTKDWSIVLSETEHKEQYQLLEKHQWNQSVGKILTKFPGKKVQHLKIVKPASGNYEMIYQL